MPAWSIFRRHKKRSRSDEIVPAPQTAGRVVAGVPAVPATGRRPSPHLQRVIAVLLLSARVRLGVLAPARGLGLPQVPGRAALVVLAKDSGLSRVRIPSPS
jgi:hypothetical protein